MGGLKYRWRAALWAGEPLPRVRRAARACLRVGMHEESARVNVGGEYQQPKVASCSHGWAPSHGSAHALLLCSWWLPTMQEGGFEARKTPRGCCSARRNRGWPW